MRRGVLLGPLLLIYETICCHIQGCTSDIHLRVSAELRILSDDYRLGSKSSTVKRQQQVWNTLKLIVVFTKLVTTGND